MLQEEGLVEGERWKKTRRERQRQSSGSEEPLAETSSNCKAPKTEITAPMLSSTWALTCVKWAGHNLPCPYDRHQAPHSPEPSQPHTTPLPFGLLGAVQKDSLHSTPRCYILMGGDRDSHLVGAIPYIHRMATHLLANEGREPLPAPPRHICMEFCSALALGWHWEYTLKEADFQLSTHSVKINYKTIHHYKLQV